MNSAECYRLLGLANEASFEEVKAAYRDLARKYHPDVSSGDQRAKDKFIEATTAYKWLLNSLPREMSQRQNVSTDSVSRQVSVPNPISKHVKQAVQVQVNPSLSPLEQQLKSSSYQQLQQLLRTQKFPRAIALVESLAHRMSRDPEVIQWQAIVYQQWGRFLIRDCQLDKARIYLRKALQTDPHNRSLWAEVEKDFRSIEQKI
ncbi:MAG: J domain-containing protein [Leptolyngbyaceae cyanobacterium CAN_BIN12]|nr:J domain-containing protein [Leptolyngbyaceae cyanobacterium CAN_BIN12]